MVASKTSMKKKICFFSSKGVVIGGMISLQTAQCSLIVEVVLF